MRFIFLRDFHNFQKRKKEKEKLTHFILSELACVNSMLELQTI
jgi:hypothetical protein